MANQERTFIMIKPDGVHRGIVGEIIKRFEQKGYKLVAMKCSCRLALARDCLDFDLFIVCAGIRGAS